MKIISQLKMKHTKLYLATLMLASLGFAGCDDNWDTPPLDGPTATIEPNTTIAELKAQYWIDDTNGVDTVGVKDSGDHIIIGGRVVSSDASGNIYKNIVIQDETAAITLSINANSLYNTYRLGQEIVIDATDMYIGKYAGLQQFGLPDYSEQYGWQTTFMPLEFFQEHAQLNGLPQPEKIDTLVTTIASLPSDVEGIQKWQSQLVRFDNVSFVNGGNDTFAEYHTTVSQDITDGTANLVVRTSGYANFYNETLPEGTGSVVGILGYFNGTWQLTLRSLDDCIFGEALPGTQSNPYTVSQAIEKQGDGNGWVKGYIVGAVAPGVSTVSSSDNIEWTAPTSLPNTLVIAESATERDYTKCLVIDLPQGSELRTKANLADNPDNLGAEITLKGTFASKYGMAGITDNGGTSSEFIFTSLSALTSLEEGFDEYASQANSSGWIDLSNNNLLGAGWTMVTLKGNKDWSMREFSENVYVTCSGYSGTAPFDAWLITPMINADRLPEKVMSFRTQVNGYGSMTSKFEVYVLTSNDPETAEKTQLNPVLAEAPASGYSDWVNSGNLDLSGFTGKIYIGFRYAAENDANYATWCFDDVKVGVKGEGGAVSGNDGSESKPYTVDDVLNGATGNGVWVSGYIVGFSSGTDASTTAKFTAEGANNLNLLLAVSADVKDASQCIAVSLPNGDVRTSLNLRDNPGNLGQAVSVKGDIAENYKIPGVKNTTDFKF